MCIFGQFPCLFRQVKLLAILKVTGKTPVLKAKQSAEGSFNSELHPSAATAGDMFKTSTHAVSYRLNLCYTLKKSLNSG